VNNGFPAESFFVVDTKEQARELGCSILTLGWQVVLDLSSYKNWGDIATVMIGAIEGLLAWANGQPKGSRVPVMLFLDEAQQFFPQNLGKSNQRFGQQLNMELVNAYQGLVAMGRKRGMTPVFFTQRLSEINKDVVGQIDLWFFMKTSLDIDIDRILDNIGDRDPNFVTADEIPTFEPGVAVVKAYTGDLFLTRFTMRDTIHLSDTPKLQDAINRYGNETKRVIPAEAVSPSPMHGENAATDDVPLSLRQTLPEQMANLPGRQLTANVVPAAAPARETPGKGEKRENPITPKMLEAAIMLRDSGMVTGYRGYMDYWPGILSDHFAQELNQQVKQAIQQRQALARAAEQAPQGEGEN
jgi:hypothetical protein